MIRQSYFMDSLNISACHFTSAASINVISEHSPPSSSHLNRDIGEWNKPSTHIPLRWDVNQFIIITPPCIAKKPFQPDTSHCDTLCDCKRQNDTAESRPSVYHRWSLTPPRTNAQHGAVGCRTSWLPCKYILSLSKTKPGQATVTTLLQMLFFFFFLCTIPPWLG